ncbi:tRNA pseudouridine(13) synthase TruD [Alteromonas sp. ASW11-36]|uniref:tRNA pseudouridine synthase D n=1 Tax=Alteromonas arenosi TaxID=3055817 RepID=A0ABT7SZQ5_9ALTE|nr:tRNA pseudouridine(13) synthase TruD [Alteromonas sp. ASW11-36]MDM7861665.1 tRNA pseudouridine(13) synthase TruD [Alteromonas sp. ASW11-36]
MTRLITSQWQYLHGSPLGRGRFKQHASDFIVTEHLGYTPTGEGEHIYVWLEKQELNTAFVAEQLAKFCNVPLRAVTYAGRKDKFALTQQWFGVHLPGKTDPDWQQFSLDGARIMYTVRHNKKLRTGNLKGNQFTIRLRAVSDSDDIARRLEQVAEQGAPNYYAEQRFGVRRDAEGRLNVGGNLMLAERMLQGEAIRNRNKRSMAISALRSWLFNQMVSERIAAGYFNTVLHGDALQLSGSNSFFIASDDDLELAKRLASGDVSITAPLVGRDILPTTDAALAFEAACLNDYQDIVTCLAELGLKQERRAVMVKPAHLQYEFSDGDCRLQFELPAGCYATAVLREVLHIDEGE